MRMRVVLMLVVVVVVLGGPLVSCVCVGSLNYEYCARRKVHAEDRQTHTL